METKISRVALIKCGSYNRPVIASKICTKCGNCVRICPDAAISIKTPLPGKIFRLIGG
ncbi:MAG: hypothetical protein GXP33_15380 [Spirochaetes bacterium]|nr:hypothetical protein [Spirochaetota bacterium]